MKPTDYPVERYTRGECFRMALKQAAVMTLPVMTVCLILLLLRLDVRLYEVGGGGTVAQVERMHRIWFYILGGLTAYLMFAGLLVSYLDYRATPSRGEMAEQYRNRAAAFEKAGEA